MKANSFSLVEMVLAIAITGFVIVSLLGLMAYASQLLHQSDNYSRLSRVSSQVLASMASESYSVTSAIASTNGSYCFTYDGLPTNSTASYYRCNVTNFPSSVPNVTNSQMIQIIIRYPAPEYTSTNWIVTSILNYD
jgi:uncharacterized protein (TIGR02598 family)